VKRIVGSYDAGQYVADSTLLSAGSLELVKQRDALLPNHVSTEHVVEVVRGELFLRQVDAGLPPDLVPRARWERAQTRIDRPHRTSHAIAGTRPVNHVAAPAARQPAFHIPK
jgi:hypothetical protein